MNLKDIIEYRRNCIIHRRPMRPHVIGMRGDRMRITEQALELLVHHQQDIYGKPSIRAIVFNFDGTYFWTSSCPEYALADTLQIYMMCGDCAFNPIYKERSIGITTLDNLRSIHHSYTFSITSNGKDKYDCQLNNEVIKYHEDGKFYHVVTNIQESKSECKMGSCLGSDLLDQILRGMMSWEIPSLNLSKIKDVDQLVDKIKFYNLFS